MGILKVLEVLSLLDPITPIGTLVGMASGRDDISVTDIGQALNILDAYGIWYYWPGCMINGEYRFQVSAKDSRRARALLGGLVI